MSHMAFINCSANTALLRISNCHSDDEGVAMIDSEFISNTNGSAIRIESRCQLKIKRGKFLNHSGSISVIQALDGSQVTIKDSQFSGSNVASAVVAKDAFLEIQHCNFTEHNAINGSAIFLNVGDALWLGQRANEKQQFFHDYQKWKEHSDITIELLKKGSANSSFEPYELRITIQADQ